MKKYYRILHEQHKEYDKLHFDNARAKVQERIVTLEYLFGKHNLTSDAEGEEMLTCEKSKVQYRVQYAKEGVEENSDYYNGYAQAIYDLFGSKCLPDEEQPKQKDCDNPLADQEGCRLNIAAMIEPALISNPDLWKRCGNYYAGPGKDTAHSFAELALEYADALISKADKGKKK